MKCAAVQTKAAALAHASADRHRPGFSSTYKTRRLLNVGGQKRAIWPRFDFAHVAGSDTTFAF